MPYSITHQLGAVISNSYGALESLVDANGLNIQNELNVMGISVNSSTGDDGDFNIRGFPDRLRPHCKRACRFSIGHFGRRMSIALNSNGSIKWQTGSGNNLANLVYQGVIIDPPTQDQRFYAGSGGGASALYPAAPRQVPKNAARELPDISWLGDPYTGAIILIREPAKSLTSPAGLGQHEPRRCIRRRTLCGREIQTHDPTGDERDG